MLFRSTDSGKTLQAARENEFVEFFIALSPDCQFYIYYFNFLIKYFSAAYHGISPKECTFSDREDISAPDAKKITFVQGGWVKRQNLWPSPDLSNFAQIEHDPLISTASDTLSIFS